MKLGDRLREVRRARAMTLAQVADVVKLSVSYLSDLERGRTNPSMDTLEQLAACYGLPAIDLLANVDGWDTPSPEGFAPGIASLVAKDEIDLETARDLNRIELRGKRPQTEDEWLELYAYLRRMIRPYLRPRER